MQYALGGQCTCLISCVHVHVVVWVFSNMYGLVMCMDIPPCAQTMPYRLDESTGLIDYDTLEKTATLFR